MAEIYQERRSIPPQRVNFPITVGNSGRTHRLDDEIYKNYLTIAASLVYEVDKSKAVILDAWDPADQQQFAQMVRDGAIGAFPFNGIYGAFGDIDNIKASKRIFEAKARPTDRALIQVALPEYLGEIGLVREPYSQRSLEQILREVHGLGVIMHPGPHIPEDLIDSRLGIPTVLPIWTEYDPLRKTLERFRRLGGRAWRGTSLNKYEAATHWRSDKVVEEFLYDLDVIAVADFSHLPESRLMSTTIVDLTGKRPRKYRSGNASWPEIESALKRHNFPRLYEEGDVIVVQKRVY